MKTINEKSTIALLFTALAVIATTPLTIKANAANDYMLLDNGDYVLTGYGSVSHDLDKLDINIDAYLTGEKESEFITYQETEDNGYIYIYSKERYTDYDMASIATYYGSFEEYDGFNDYVELDLTLVSYDSTSLLQKFMIHDLHVDDGSDHMVRIRQIYNHDKRTELDFVFGIGQTYQFNAEENKYKLDMEDVVRIPEKVVAYTLITQKEQFEFGVGLTFEKHTVEYLIQRNFVAFNLSEDVGDIRNITSSYDGYTYAGITDIELNYNNSTATTHQNSKGFATKLANKDIRSHIQEDQYYEVITEKQKYVTTVGNFHHEFEYEHGWLFNKVSTETSFDTIMKVSDIPKEEYMYTEHDMSQYEYIFTFDIRRFDVSFFSKSTPVNIWSTDYISIGTLSKPLHEDDECPDTSGELPLVPFPTPCYHRTNDVNINLTDTTNNKHLTNSFITSHFEATSGPLEVENFTILEFSTISNGSIKDIVVIDTYDDSVGGIQINPPLGTPVPGGNFLSELIKWILIIGACLVGLFVLVQIIKFIKWMVK